MAHVTPFILAAGRGVQGSSLGYHAYSLRVDNISNQWLQEESTLVWIPPYSLGVVVRLWGTSVALLIPSSPVGQAQQAPIAGEYAVAVYSDELRAENPGVPVRQFTLVQAVSDLNMGPQPALPPVGVDRLYADAAGNIHHIHSDGTDLTLFDRTNIQPTINASPLGGDLYGTIAAAHISVQAGQNIQMANGTYLLWSDASITRWNPAQLRLIGTAGVNIQGPVVIEGTSGLTAGGIIAAGPGGAIGSNGDVVAARSPGVGYIWLGTNGQHYLGFDGSNYQMITSGLVLGGALNCGAIVSSGTIQSGGNISAGGGGGFFTSSIIYLNNPSNTMYLQQAGTNVMRIAVQSSSGGGYWQFFDGAGGFYLNMAYDTGGQIHYTGYNTLNATAWRIEGQSCGIQVGRSNLELQAVTHFLTGGACYITLDCSAVSYATRSSRKIKEGIVRLGDDAAMARVLDQRAHPVNFRWAWAEWRKREAIGAAPNSPVPRNQQVGFVAEDMQYVVPEVVSYDSDTGEATGINYGALTAILWAAVRQLDRRVKALGG